MSSVILRLETTSGPQRIEVEAAVFDCDGLLMDSESVWVDMIREWITEQRLAADPQDYLGFSADDVAVKLYAQLPAAQRQNTSSEELVAELSKRYSALLNSGVVPMPGAVELMTSLAQHIPVAVASNGLRDDVRSMLGASPMLAAAQAVCTVEEVSAGKPEPDLYLRACQKLQVAPQRAVAFEDSAAGAQAAIAAGLVVVGVNSDPEVELPVSLRMSDLEQVSLFTKVQL